MRWRSARRRGGLPAGAGFCPPARGSARPASVVLGCRSSRCCRSVDLMRFKAKQQGSLERFLLYFFKGLDLVFMLKNPLFFFHIRILLFSLVFN